MSAALEGPEPPRDSRETARLCHPQPDAAPPSPCAPSMGLPGGKAAPVAGAAGPWVCGPGGGHRSLVSRSFAPFLLLLAHDPVMDSGGNTLCALPGQGEKGTWCPPCHPRGWHLTPAQMLMSAGGMALKWQWWCKAPGESGCPPPWVLSVAWMVAPDRHRAWCLSARCAWAGWHQAWHSNAGHLWLVCLALGCV